MLYAAVFIPDFPLRAVMRHEPDLRSAAVAIVEGTPPSCFVIVANPVARQLGVIEGMSKREAAQAPSLEIRRRSLEEEASAHAALLDLGWSVSPRVEETAPDTVVIGLEGLDRLLGSPERIARRLAQGATSLGLEAQAAVASNIEAAVHAARGLPGITVVPEGREAERLASLPVDLLAADCLDSIPRPDKRSETSARAAIASMAEILVTLDRWGVRSFGDFAALPTPDLAERLGQEGVRLQRLARGQGTRTLVPAEPELRFAEAMELDDPIGTLDLLMFILGRLLDSLCARLRARSLATQEMRLQLWLDIADLKPEPSKIVNRQSPMGGPEPRTLTLPVPTLNTRTMLKLWLLNLQSDPPAAPILKMALETAPAKPRTAQGGLFQPLAPDPEKLEVTLARIAKVVGKGKAGSPEILDTYRPEAFRLRRFVAQEAHLENQKTKIGNRRTVQGIDDCKSVRQEQSSIEDRQSSISKTRLALRVFRPPLRATVEVQGDIPIRVCAGEIRGEVVGCGGPWRTSGEWWGDAWEQDEWDVEILSLVLSPSSLVKKSQPFLYRLYCDVATGQWFVRGIYD